MKKNRQGNDAGTSGSPGGAVVVFAKCPVPGVCKTRLAPLLGSDGAASLAEAMLSDVLVSLSSCPRLENSIKVLIYAPGTEEGEARMVSLLESLELPHTTNAAIGNEQVFLMPMVSSIKSTTALTTSDLTTSTLGDKLTDALERTRALLKERKKKIRASASRDAADARAESNENVTENEAVLFLGMDSPELPVEEIVYGLRLALSSGGTGTAVAKAHMCPADDGGYGMLSVPGHAPSHQIFAGVRWSDPLTAVSQLKALSDAGVESSIGKIMYDVDEPQDVRGLAERLVRARCSGRRVEMSEGLGDAAVGGGPGGGGDDALGKFASGILHNRVLINDSEKSTDCLYTWKALLDLNVVGEIEGGSDCYCVNHDMFQA